jgi:hypothetical protein
VGLVRSDDLKERFAYIFRVERIPLKMEARRLLVTADVSRSRIASTMRVEATGISETSVLTTRTRRHIPDNGTCRCHPRDNLGTYMQSFCCVAALMLVITRGSMNVQQKNVNMNLSLCVTH